jgi:hypothetical protein
VKPCDCFSFIAGAVRRHVGLLRFLKRDSLDLTAEKLGKQELDGHEGGVSSLL